MHWVIQENMHRENGIEELLSLLDRAGISYSLHKVVPFVGEIEPDIDPKDHVMVVGSYSMRHVARRKGWVPGVFDLGDLTYQDHIEHWGDHMLNADAVFCRFDEVLEKIPSDWTEFFLRPVVDSKFFAGAVFEYGQFEDWQRKVITVHEEDELSVRANTQVMACSTKVILREYRTWVVDGRVVTASLYKQGNKVLYSSDVDQDILDFAQARASEWQPRRAFVLDVALMPDGSKKVVETNTFNAAGLYAANVGRIVDAIMGMEF